MDLLVPTILAITGELPAVAVLVTGLALAARRRDRLPRRARLMLTSGLTVLLVTWLVSLTWNLTYSHLLMRSDWIRDGGIQRLSLVGMAVAWVTGLGFPVGVGLLIGSALAGRRPAEPPALPWPGSTGQTVAVAAGGSGAGPETTGPTAPAAPPGSLGQG